MTGEELAFVNQQLAGMLRSGIPLEGALGQLCANMRGGRLRDELRALEADLAKGIPLKDALATRRLPEFYVKMIQLGAQTNDLPGVLSLVADYYQRAHLVATRLKGLLVYPAIVLVVALGLSAFIAVVCSSVLVDQGGLLSTLWNYRPNTASELSGLLFQMWMPAAALLVVLFAAAVAWMVPGFRQALRWRLPGFRENSLTNVASAMNLMLSQGTNLGDALELTRQLEAGTPAGFELEQWRSRLATGHAKIEEFAAGSKVFPPLFIWLVAQGGENLAAGFKKAADIYHARALYRVELLLYGTLPVSVLVLGVMILGQFQPLFRVLVTVIDSLGDMGGV